MKPIYTRLRRRTGTALTLGLCLTLAGGLVRAADTLAPAGAVFDVRAYGAKGDGLTLDSGAINQAVVACAAAGGGAVRLPPGRYLSGTIHLRSGVTFELENGATLLGTTNLEAYQTFVPPPDTPEGRFRSPWHRALILGDGVRHVAIVGPGTLDGRKVFDPHGEEGMRGPHTVLLGNCQDVVLRDFTVRDSANYAILLEHCERVEARGLTITGGWDGVHFRGWPGRPCRDVNIVGCRFYTGDDAIAGRYWERVVIADCILNSSCNGIRLIGPATHLVVQGCLVYGPGVQPHRSSNRYNMLAGINLQPGAWDATQGALDDVLISDITMRDVSTPFLFVLYPGNTAGRIAVERVSATGIYRAAASVESWAPTPFTNVTFRDVSLEYLGGGKPDSAGRPRRPGVDARPLPAWGFYARQVQQLTLDNVRLRCQTDDLRPVMLGDGIRRLVLEDVKFPRQPGVAEPLVLTNVVEVERP